nr:MAG TPA: hypothetical protein [Bacteriophage sp.]
MSVASFIHLVHNMKYLCHNFMIYLCFPLI